jgi:hypothetical protein
MIRCSGWRRIVAIEASTDALPLMRHSISSAKPRQDTAEQVAIYCGKHPRSPSAVRRPKLILRGQVWIALIGDTVQRGIAGFGPTIQAALGAFDRQYLNALRPPSEAKKVPLAASNHQPGLKFRS